MFFFSKKWQQQLHSDTGSPSPGRDGCQRSSQRSWEDRKPSILWQEHPWQRHFSCETVNARANEWLHIYHLPGLKRQRYPPRNLHLGHWLGHHLQWYDPCLKHFVKVCFIPKQCRQLQLFLRRLVVVPPASLLIFTHIWNTSGTAADVLQEVRVPIVGQRECECSYPGLTMNMICAGFREGGKDSCQVSATFCYISSHVVCFGLFFYLRGGRFIAREVIREKIRCLSSCSL